MAYAKITILLLVICTAASAELPEAVTLRGLSLGTTCEQSLEEMRQAAASAGATVVLEALSSGARPIPVCSRGPNGSILEPSMVRDTPGVIRDEVRVGLNSVSGMVESIHSTTTWQDLPNGMRQTREVLEAALIEKFGKPAVTGTSDIGNGVHFIAFGGVVREAPVRTTSDGAFAKEAAALSGVTAVVEIRRSSGRLGQRIVLKRQVTTPPSINL